jgi:tRNA(Arg) A34 adenosine deaminase TadA
MCLGAIYWARPKRVVYAATRQQAAAAGFDDEYIYREIEVPQAERRIVFELSMEKGAEEVFDLWRERGDKSLY